MKEVAAAAFELLRSQGFAALTTRNIAQALKSSTMPIYSAMGSMEELVQELRTQSLALLEEYQQRPITPNPYLNRAAGYVAFARSEQGIFRFLFIDRPVSMDEQSTLQPAVMPDLQTRSDWFGRIDESTMDAISFKSWFFVHGLAMSLAMGIAGPFDDQKIISLLQEAGGAFLLFEKKAASGQ